MCAMAGCMGHPSWNLLGVAPFLVALLVAALPAHAAASADAGRALRIGCGGTAAEAPDGALLDLGPASGIDLVDAIRLARMGTGLDLLPPADATFSFESGLEGWYPRGTDLDSPAVEWSIAPSTEMAADGKSSAKLFLANYNDAGKIWLERPFRLLPDTAYRVRLSFSFASRDHGFINLWTIIAGARKDPPRTRDDLTYQGSTGNGSDTDVGYVWQDKAYDLEAGTSPDGRLTVYLGVWGTWESPGTYYVDNVRVTFTRK